MLRPGEAAVLDALRRRRRPRHRSSSGAAMKFLTKLGLLAGSRRRACRAAPAPGRSNPRRRRCRWSASRSCCGDLARPAPRGSLRARSCRRPPPRACASSSSSVAASSRPCPARGSRRAGAPTAVSGRGARTPGCRASVRKRIVSAMSAPPSIFTICAPAAISCAALRKACCGLSWKLPKGMSAMMNGAFAAARHARGVVDHVAPASPAASSRGPAARLPSESPISSVSTPAVSSSARSSRRSRSAW